MFQKIKNWLNTNNHLLWVSIPALMIIGLISVYFVALIGVAVGAAAEKTKMEGKHE